MGIVGKGESGERDQKNLTRAFNRFSGYIYEAAVSVLDFFPDSIRAVWSSVCVNVFGYFRNLKVG